MQQKQYSDSDHLLPAMRMTALSAGSRTSPDADLERLTRWCLGRFQGNVSPGRAEEHSSLLLSSDADLSRRRGREVTDIACNRVKAFGTVSKLLYICCQSLDSTFHCHHKSIRGNIYWKNNFHHSSTFQTCRVDVKAH